MPDTLWTSRPENVRSFLSRSFLSPSSQDLTTWTSVVESTCLKGAVHWPDYYSVLPNILVSHNGERLVILPHATNKGCPCVCPLIQVGLLSHPAGLRLSFLVSTLVSSPGSFPRSVVTSPSISFFSSSLCIILKGEELSHYSLGRMHIWQHTFLVGIQSGFLL